MKITLPVLITLVFAVTGAPCLAGKTHAPLSPKILAAKTVYVENHGSAKLADKAYDEMKKWGRWEIVQDRAKADLVLVLSEQVGQSSRGTTAVYDPTPAPGMGGAGTWKYGSAGGRSSGAISLEAHDSKTGETLYSDARPGRAAESLIKEFRKRIEEQEEPSKTK